MLKSILGVILGYVALMVFLFMLLTVLYLALGAERVFQPGTLQITMPWIALLLLGGLCAGLLGGVVCQAVSGSARACTVFAAIVFILSILMCLPSIMRDETPQPRAGDLPTMAAMQNAQAPDWMHFLAAVCNSGGILLGGRWKRK